MKENGTGATQMGKIKSTRDLIMERTRHLSMTDEEKESMKREELSRKVRGIVIRFLGGERDARFLAQEIEQLAAGDPEETQKLCLTCFQERLAPFADNERILSGVETIAGVTERRRWEKAIQAARTPILDQEELILEKVQSLALEALASRGLKGSALKPCVSGSPLWEEESAKLATQFRESVRVELENPTQR
jgi:hypothetical protein